MASDKEKLKSAKAEAFKYWAFISYSSMDRRIGAEFHRHLERFVVPRELRGRKSINGPIPKRIIPIFRDRWDLDQTDDLGQKIASALAMSRSLVVLCSPRSASSKWVNKEISTFRQINGRDRIIPVMVSGTPTEYNAKHNPEGAFPPALTRRLFENGEISGQLERGELYAPDLREPSGTGGGDGIEYARLKVVAKMLGLSLTELLSRYSKAERREKTVRQIITISAIFLTTISVIGATGALRQRQEVLATQSRFHARIADKLIDDHKPYAARLVSLDAMPTTIGSIYLRPQVNVLDRVAIKAASQDPLVAIWRHKRWVDHATFSGDGTKVATASYDGSVRVWHAATGKSTGVVLHHRRHNHSQPVGRVYFGPDDQHMITITDSASPNPNVVRLWNLAMSPPTEQILSSNVEISNVTFSTDGTVVFGQADDGRLLTWSAVTGAKLNDRLSYIKKRKYLFVGRGGECIVSVSRENMVQVWDEKSKKSLGAPFKVPVAPRRIGWDIAIDPTCNKLVIERQIWNARSGQKIGIPITQNERNGKIGKASFSQDGKRIVTGAHSGNPQTHAQVWDANTGIPVGRPLTHQAFSVDAQFSFDGDRVVTWTWVQGDESTGYAQIWDAETGWLLGVRRSHSDGVTHAAFNRQGTQIVTSSQDGTARLWDAKKEMPTSKTIRLPDGIDHVAISPLDNRFATATRLGEVSVWNSRDTSFLSISKINSANVKNKKTQKIRIFQYSRDGKSILSITETGQLQLRNGETGFPIGATVTDEQPIVSAAISPDGMFLATASGAYSSPGEGYVQIWDAKTRERIGPKLKHGAYVTRVTFSPDSRSILTASVDDTFRVYDVYGNLRTKLDGRDENALRLAPQPINAAKLINQRASATFSPDGTRIVAATAAGARIWNATTGKSLGPTLSPHRRGATLMAAISPDGSKIFAANPSSVSVWDIETYRPTGLELTAEWGSVFEDVRFGGDSLRLITASGNGARVWDIKSGAALGAPLEFYGQIYSAMFDADGTHVLTYGGVKQSFLRIWRAPTAAPQVSGSALAKILCRGLPKNLRKLDRTNKLKAIADDTFIDLERPGPCDRYGFLSFRYFANFLTSIRQ